MYIPDETQTKTNSHWANSSSDDENGEQRKTKIDDGWNVLRNRLLKFECSVCTLEWTLFGYSYGLVRRRNWSPFLKSCREHVIVLWCVIDLTGNAEISLTWHLTEHKYLSRSKVRKNGEKESSRRVKREIVSRRSPHRTAPRLSLSCRRLPWQSQHPKSSRARSYLIAQSQYHNLFELFLIHPTTTNHIILNSHLQLAQLWNQWLSNHEWTF